MKFIIVFCEGLSTARKKKIIDIFKVIYNVKIFATVSSGQRLTNVYLRASGLEDQTHVRRKFTVCVFYHQISSNGADLQGIQSVRAQEDTFVI